MRRSCFSGFFDSRHALQAHDDLRHQRSSFFGVGGWLGDAVVKAWRGRVQLIAPLMTIVYVRKVGLVLAAQFIAPYETLAAGVLLAVPSVLLICLLTSGET